ncbi:hypothetical protein F7725_021235 [Dissostichus mawsoni]|uniref:Uncharacterized protein n=1 Tax=Dissostichus mawsoni TaxID=36200 RepID=A0A7J5YI89_DISMA|nr:hypothetical protein F7725_021235 [Dissostichus mawsoni]
MEEDEEDLFLEQCIPPANIADWGDEEEEEETSVNLNQQQGLTLIDSYEFNYTLPVFPDSLTPEMQPIQIASLVFYGLVVLLGVPGTLWWSG